MDQVEAGHQFANSELARNLSDDFDYLGIIRRGEHVTVLYRQRSTKEGRRMAGPACPRLRERKAQDFRRVHLLTSWLGFDMSETIQDGKFVELTYKVTDKKSGHVLTTVEFPLGYVHGHNEILAPFVHRELEGRSPGEVIEVPIDGNRIFGARDESLVFTDRIENVPEEYRQVGTSILMENDKGQTRSFLVTLDGRRDADGRRQQSALRKRGRLYARDTDCARRQPMKKQGGRGDRCAGGYRPSLPELSECGLFE